MSNPAEKLFAPSSEEKKKREKRANKNKKKNLKITAGLLTAIAQQRAKPLISNTAN
jgi:hypothetical protein